MINFTNVWNQIYMPIVFFGFDASVALHVYN